MQGYDSDDVRGYDDGLCCSPVQGSGVGSPAQDGDYGSPACSHCPVSNSLADDEVFQGLHTAITKIETMSSQYEEAVK
jgi:hypothetical protein